MKKLAFVLKEYVGEELRFVFYMGCALFIAFATYSYHYGNAGDLNSIDKFTQRLESTTHTTRLLLESDCFHNLSNADQAQGERMELTAVGLPTRVIISESPITYVCNKNVAYSSNIIIIERFNPHLHPADHKNVTQINALGDEHSVKWH